MARSCLVSVAKFVPTLDLAEVRYRNDPHHRSGQRVNLLRTMFHDKCSIDHFFPVSNHSIDFSNSSLILSKISAPISFSPRSIVRKMSLADTYPPRKLFLGHI